MASFVRNGKKILAIGRNYAAHIKELNSATPTEPFFFLKPTTSYLTKGQGPVEIPRGIVLHHEVELGVVIAKSGRNIPPHKALAHISGYCLAIDYTARNLQDRVKAASLPWTAVKGFDTFCPVSDFVEAGRVKDHSKLELWFSVNGVEKQRAETSLMINTIEDLIAHCSSVMLLEEGDVILTGTPAGVGPIVAGDKIAAGLVQDGVELARLEHDTIDRVGGYTFKP